MAKLFKLNRFKPGPPLRRSPIDGLAGDKVYIFRSPTVAGLLWAPTRIPELQSPNLLLSLLVQPLAPFVPDEILQPQATARCTRDHSQANLLLTLLPTTMAPFDSFEWVQPRAIIARVSEQTQNLSLTLLPTTQRPLFSEMEDWDRPIWTPVARQSEFQNLQLTTLLVPAAAAPFFSEMEDWDRPIWTPVARSVELSNLLLSTLAVPYILRTPTVAGRTYMAPQRQANHDPENLLLTLLAVQAPGTPFMPDEWVANRLPTARVVEPVQNRLLDLLPLTPAPFKAIEWAAMQRASWRQSEVSCNSLLELLTAPVQTAPFLNWEWSRPVRSAIKQPEPSFNYPLKTLPQPSPFVSYDWVRHGKTRTRYAPFADPNLPMTTLFGLNPVGAPYIKPIPKDLTLSFDAHGRAFVQSARDRQQAFDAEQRVRQFPAKDRTFTLEH